MYNLSGLYKRMNRQLASSFVEISKNVKETASILLEMLHQEDDSLRDDLASQIKQHEELGDRLTNELFIKINKLVFCSLSKEDIHILGFKIDEFLDKINECARALLIYNPKKIETRLVNLGEIIYKDAQCISDNVKLFKDINLDEESMIKNCVKIKELEHDADSYFENYVTFIFCQEKDPVELSKYESLAKLLEETTDYAYGVSQAFKKLYKLS
ncbi:MAG: DUF47 family protein [Bacteroidales bacterium]